MRQAHPALAAHALSRDLKRFTERLTCFTSDFESAVETVSQRVGTVLGDCVSGDLHQHVLAVWASRAP